MKEIRIDGVIGQGEDEISAAMIREQLPENGTDPIRISLHSEGGSVFEGFAIHDVLAKYAGQKIVAVESTAFSIASFIAMVGDEIDMAPNAYLMLHNPRISIEGDDEELGKSSTMIADLKTNMVNAYAQRTGKSVTEIQSVLKQETYFNATDAVAFGLADKVTEKAIKGRPLACVSTMPHGVFSALYGAGSGGDNDSKKGKPMTESTPVAATVHEIRTAYPKAKSDFILDCITKSMPMASVASAAAEEMMKENDDLKKQVAALQDDMAKAKAKAEADPAEPDDDDKADAKAKAEADPAEPDEDDKADAKAKARAKGVKPIAKGTSGRPSALIRWNEAIVIAQKSFPKDKMKAVALANRNNPGLREAFILEVNAR